MLLLLYVAEKQYDLPVKQRSRLPISRDGFFISSNLTLVFGFFYYLASDVDIDFFAV